MTQDAANSDTQHGHVPVMRDRMVELVGQGVNSDNAPERPVIVDGTLGAGGHSEAFLDAFPHAIVVGLDRDPNALAEANERLAGYGDRFVSYQTRFDGVTEALEDLMGQGELPESMREHGISGLSLIHI